MLPNLVIIGAMKCGTSSLHSYLNVHPDVHMSVTKELDFFIEEKNWSQGLRWYESQFTIPAKIVGESSPNYTKCTLFKGVPERMHRVIPDAKLIYLVRDPVERILSQYVHMVAAGYETRSFAEALKDLSNNEYVDNSRYFFQVSQFLQRYAPERILVVAAEDLTGRRSLALREVFSFLGVDADFSHSAFSREHHKSSDKRQRTALGRLVSKASRLSPLARRLAPGLVERQIDRPTIDDSLRRRLYDLLCEDLEGVRAFSRHPLPQWGAQ